MIVPFLVIALIGVVLVLRAVGGVHAPSRGERIYVSLSPLPLVVSLVVPAVIGLTAGFSGPQQQALLRGSTWIGLGLSVLLGIVGLGLVLRLVKSRARWGWPLGASVVLAGSPFALVAVSVGLLWLVGRMR